MTAQTDYTEAAQRIRAELWRDSWGQRIGERHRREWPMLWEALDHLAELVDRNTPPDKMNESLF